MRRLFWKPSGEDMEKIIGYFKGTAQGRESEAGRPTWNLDVS